MGWDLVTQLNVFATAAVTLAAQHLLISWSSRGAAPARYRKTLNSERRFLRHTGHWVRTCKKGWGSRPQQDRYHLSEWLSLPACSNLHSAA